MRIITLTNQKGGVGKTTTTVNLAAALSEMGRRVLLIDLDPQAHLTTFLGISPEDIKASAYDILTQNVPISEAMVAVREKISIVCSELNLTAAEQELVSVVGRESILRDALKEQEGQWDYVFIDCPPSLGLLTLNALVATKEVFIPLQAHFLSLQGLSQLIESLLLVYRRLNPSLRVTGLMFCMFDSRTTLSGEILNEIETFFSGERNHDSPWRDIRIFNTRVRQNVKLAESPSYGKTIFEYEPHCHGANDYMALAKEVESMSATGSDAEKMTIPYGENRIVEHETSAAVEELPGQGEQEPPAPPEQSVHEAEAPEAAGEGQEENRHNDNDSQSVSEIREHAVPEEKTESRLRSNEQS